MDRDTILQVLVSELQALLHGDKSTYIGNCQSMIIYAMVSPDDMLEVSKEIDALLPPDKQLASHKD
jgi:hypothetical protein